MWIWFVVAGDILILLIATILFFGQFRKIAINIRFISYFVIIVVWGIALWIYRDLFNSRELWTLAVILLIIAAVSAWLLLSKNVVKTLHLIFASVTAIIMLIVDFYVASNITTEPKGKLELEQLTTEVLKDIEDQKEEQFQKQIWENIKLIDTEPVNSPLTSITKTQDSSKINVPQTRESVSTQIKKASSKLRQTTIAEDIEDQKEQQFQEQIGENIRLIDTEPDNSPLTSTTKTQDSSKIDVPQTRESVSTQIKKASSKPKQATITVTGFLDGGRLPRTFKSSTAAYIKTIVSKSKMAYFNLEKKNSIPIVSTNYSFTINNAVNIENLLSRKQFFSLIDAAPQYTITIQPKTDEILQQFATNQTLTFLDKRSVETKQLSVNASFHKKIPFWYLCQEYYFQNSEYHDVIASCTVSYANGNTETSDGSLSELRVTSWHRNIGNDQDVKEIQFEFWWNEHRCLRESDANLEHLVPETITVNYSLVKELQTKGVQDTSIVNRYMTLPEFLQTLKNITLDDVLKVVAGGFEINPKNLDKWNLGQLKLKQGTETLNLKIILKD